MQWLDKLVKVLALALDTHIEPEQRVALGIAAELAAKHGLSLGRAYLRIESNMPSTFLYLEAKREAAGLACFIVSADREPHMETWSKDLAAYPGNRLAFEAMLSCVVRPMAPQGRGR